MKKISFFVFLFFVASNITTAQNRFFTREGIVYLSLQYLGENLIVSNNNLSCTLENNNFNFICFVGKFKYNDTVLKNKIAITNIDSVKIKGAAIKGEILGFDSIDTKINNSYQLAMNAKIRINDKEVEIVKPITIKIIDNVVYLKTFIELNINDFFILHESNPLNTNKKINITLDCALNQIH